MEKERVSENKAAAEFTKKLVRVTNKSEREAEMREFSRQLLRAGYVYAVLNDRCIHVIQNGGGKVYAVNPKDLDFEPKRGDLVLFRVEDGKAVDVKFVPGKEW